MKRPDSPCLHEGRKLGLRDCPNRTPGCHSKCDKWDEYLKKKKEYNEVVTDKKMRGGFTRRYES